MKDQKGTQAAGNKGTPEKNQLKELSKEEMEDVTGGGGLILESKLHYFTLSLNRPHIYATASLG